MNTYEIKIVMNGGNSATTENVKYKGSALELANEIFGTEVYGIGSSTPTMTPHLFIKTSNICTVGITEQIEEN